MRIAFGRALGAMPAMALAMALWPALAGAQAPAAPAATPPATTPDTPAIRLGATIFTNYTFQASPEITDADGNTVNRNAFDVARAYLNVTGNISRHIAFRITPDISRETNTASSLAGSLVFRIKYGYLQANLDDWLTPGSFARLGIQQTPYLDYLEGIYRYRFQGTLFVERAGYFSSADAGASFRYNMPSNYGDVHVGLYNGEGYTRAEANDQKAIMIRGSVRPFATGAPLLRGLRAALLYDADQYLKEAERTRLVGNVTFEHRFINVGFEYIDATDRISALPTAATVHGTGYSLWATPKTSTTGTGWEGLLRYDHLRPNTANQQQQNRMILGVAYWFPHLGTVTSALLFDYDAQLFKNIVTTPTKSVAVHALVNF